MLYRHVRPLFLSTAFSDQALVGPMMRVRPLDTDAPDHQMRFLLWGVLQAREPVVQPAPAADSKGPDVVVVTAARVPKLRIEMSADGEDWAVVSTLEPRERPYLITVAHVLQFVRVRLETGGAPARGRVLVMANTPFELEGRSPLVGPHPDPEPVVVTGGCR